MSAGEPADAAPSTAHRSAFTHDSEARGKPRGVGPDRAERAVVPTDAQAAAALQGATWMVAAFVASGAVELVPATILVGSAALVERVDVMIGISVVSAVLALVLRAIVLVLGLRMAQRPTRSVPWVVIAIAALLAVISYPVSMGAHAAINYAWGRSGYAQLAEWTVANAYIGMAGGVGHVLLVIGVLIAAAVAWSRRLPLATSAREP